MFLQHIADLKLLELKPEETSTLSVFRTETQRELCRTVVRDLSAVAGSGVVSDARDRADTHTPRTPQKSLLWLLLSLPFG